MLHHDNRNYNVAVSEAAAQGRVKMQRIIDNGIASAEAVINQVQTQVVLDRIAPAKALRFGRYIAEESDKGKFSKPSPIAVVLPDETANVLHEHALGQVAERAGVPQKYVASLMERGDWGADLIAHNFHEIFERGNGSRYLIRSVGEEARGFLSDRFRRLDSRPLLDSFIGACKEIGALPVQGHALDTKVCMRAVLPMIFEPVDNEVLLFGIEWSNSDFGSGTHRITLFGMRVWCTNLATLDDVLTQVHLGRKLDDNIEYSQRTYELDTQANVSALHDTVLHCLSPQRVNGYLEAVKQAHATPVDSKSKSGPFESLKKKLSQGEYEAVKNVFDSPDVVNLPPGNTQYRLSNAVSWIANAKDISPERQLDLQKIAGEYIPRLEKVKAVEV